MKDNGRQTEDLTAKQQRAIEALLSQSSIRDAAKKAQASETTLFRWLQDEAFKKAYLDARREATKQAIAQLQQAGGEAVKTLREVMKDKKANPGARVSAAKAVLEMSIKAVELEDLAERVNELERHLEEQKALQGKL